MNDRITPLDLLHHLVQDGTLLEWVLFSGIVLLLAFFVAQPIVALIDWYRAPRAVGTSAKGRTIYTPRNSGPSGFIPVEGHNDREGFPRGTWVL